MGLQLAQNMSVYLVVEALPSGINCSFAFFLVGLSLELELELDAELELLSAAVALLDGGTELFEPASVEVVSVFACALLAVDADFAASAAAAAAAAALAAAAASFIFSVVGKADGLREPLLELPLLAFDFGLLLAFPFEGGDPWRDSALCAASIFSVAASSWLFLRFATFFSLPAAL